MAGPREKAESASFRDGQGIMLTCGEMLIQIEGQIKSMSSNKNRPAINYCGCASCDFVDRFSRLGAER